MTMRPTPHPALFPAPDDPSAMIWRYLSFTKFVSILSTRTLFFSRSDQLGDPFEGSFPAPNLRVRNRLKELVAEKLAQGGLSKAEAARSASDFRSDEAFNRWVRQWVYVNCWHLNPYESAAMWKLYGESRDAIAIRSTYTRLRSALEPTISVGTVTYVDFDKSYIQETDLFSRFAYKRSSFEHEHELRAIFIELPIEDGNIGREAANDVCGQPVAVNLHKLIDRIYIAPTAPDWFAQLVKDVMRRYGIRKRVMHSSLAAEPLF